MFLQTRGPLFLPVKSRKMKGLLGINYNQRLADDEDLMRMISLLMMMRKVVTKISFSFYGHNWFLVFITGGLILEGTKHNFLCDNIFV